MTDLIVIGMTVCDITVKPVTPDIFQQDSAPVDVSVSPGGDACNVAVNAAALGMKTALVSAVGKDANGNFILEYLKSSKVNTDYMKQTERFPTGTSVVMVEPSGERHFLGDTKIFQEITPDQVPPRLLRGAKILSLNSCYRLPELDDGGAVPLFRTAHEHGVLTAMDTVWNRQGSWMERIRPALHHTDFFFPSYKEAVQITGETDVRRMREAMKPFGLKVFGVKMGEKGSYVTDFHREYFAEPCRTEKIVSTIGAGDSWVAGFLTAQIKGMDLYESARFAGACAACTLRIMGAVGGMPPFEEVERFRKEG